MPVYDNATKIVTCSGGIYFDRNYYVDLHLPLALASWQKHGLESAAAFFPRDADAVDVSVGIYRFLDEAALHTALASAEQTPLCPTSPALLTLTIPELSVPRSDCLLPQCIGRRRVIVGLSRVADLAICMIDGRLNLE